MVTLLLARGLDPNQQAADRGAPPLHWAIGGYRCAPQEPHLDVARILLESGANPNSHRPLTRTQIAMGIQGPGGTPLYEALYHDCVEMSELLIQNGANKYALVY